MPCTPARARMLLRGRKAAVPQALSLHDYPQGLLRWSLQPIELKADPGSKVTGVALVADYAKRGQDVVWAKSCSTECELLKTPLIQDVVSEEAGVIARPDTVLHASITQARGGTKRVSNLTVACEDCNQSKNTLPQPNSGTRTFQKQALRPLKDAACS